MFTVEEFMEKLEEEGYEEFKVKRHIVKNDRITEFTVIATKPKPKPKPDDFEERVMQLLVDAKRPVSQRHLSDEIGIGRRKTKKIVDELENLGKVIITSSGIKLS